MKRARFIPAQVKTAPDDRPPACPHCGDFNLVKRGCADKPIIDLYG